MNSKVFDILDRLPELDVLPGASDLDIAAMESRHGITLPRSHADVLKKSNGIEAYGGYVRLFGIRQPGRIDLDTWNDFECWKFAWREACPKYFCFAETAWGDQYAYDTRSMHEDGDSAVYFLESVSMTPEFIADSFSTFIEREFARSASDPYDAMIKEARRKLGRLDSLSHLTYIPSLLLGGIEDVDRISVINARASMISNGDIAIQLEDHPSDGDVNAIDVYQDTLGRSRVRLVWS